MEGITKRERERDNRDIESWEEGKRTENLETRSSKLLYKKFSIKKEDTDAKRFKKNLLKLGGGKDC